LIVTDGEPNFVPIPDTQLLYVANTTASIFRLMATKRLTSASLDAGTALRRLKGHGNMCPAAVWRVISLRFLTPALKKMSKASVPGTAQAREALVANSVPQTTKVNNPATQHGGSWN